MPIEYERWKYGEPDDKHLDFSWEFWVHGADCVVDRLGFLIGKYEDVNCEQYTAGAACQTNACYV